MSLLLLSNDEKLNAATNTGISAANSWTNNTQTPLVIKKNSEIALQSLKVNRTANTVVTDQDNKLWMYIGKGRGDTAPLLERIEDPRTTCFTALLPRDDYSAQSFVDDCLIPSIKKGCYHPDYIDRVSGTVKESTVGQFEGYNIVFGEGNTAPADVFPADGEFIPATTHHDGEITDDFTWSNSTKRFTKGTDVVKRGYGIATKYPMSCRQGKHVVNFANAGDFWAAGLSRFATKDIPVPFWGEEILGDWYDFGVIREGGSDLLKIYHSVVSDSDNPVLKPREVVYYGYTGAAMATPYDLGKNTSGFNELEFFFNGDQVEVYLLKGGGARTLICSPDLGTPGKDNYFKPVNMGCQFLYPKYEIVDDSAYFTMVHNTGVDLANFAYDGVGGDGKQTRQDFYVTSLGLTGTAPTTFFDQCKENDVGTVFNDFDDDIADVHTFLKFSAEMPKIALIVSPDSGYYNPSDKPAANTGLVLGFNDGSVIDNPVQAGSTANGSKTFASHDVPQNIVRESMFVRLTSTTQRSINGYTGNQSKIIYHCPRFDSGGNDQGGLFFEVGEKTYLDLGNVDEIQSNSFSVDIVNRQERPIAGLIGNTVAMLHIREKK